ncbi:response regulator [Shimia sp. MIT1388]|uniref:response regulator n=1 Tax=Shimia sp. MIT1388 TaxID=3096992 RepID=UPI00399C1E35
MKTNGSTVYALRRVFCGVFLAFGVIAGMGAIASFYFLRETNSIVCSTDSELRVLGRSFLMADLFVADDNPDFASFVAEVAEDLGWTVTTCQNGLELLDQLGEAETPALVFLDVLMPEMDGIEAIKSLAEMDRDIRVRFVTGGAACNVVAAERISAGRGLRLGPTILKPIALRELRNELQRELDTGLKQSA